MSNRTTKKKKDKPKFIVLFGPTGSGKSGAFDLYYKKLRPKCERKDTTVTCNDGRLPPYFASVDNFIENDKEYRDSMKTLSTNLLANLMSKSGSALRISSRRKQAMIQNQAQAMTDLYYRIRNKKGYNLQNELGVLNSIKSAVDIGEARDIVFEITGTNPDTIKKICDDNLFEFALKSNPALSEYAKLKTRYDVVVVVPFASYILLQERIVGRFMSAAQRNPSSARMVPSGYKHLRNSEETALQNLATLVRQRCVQSVMVYDNTSGPKAVEWFQLEIGPDGCQLLGLNKRLGQVGSAPFRKVVDEICIGRKKAREKKTQKRPTRRKKTEMMSGG